MKPLCIETLSQRRAHGGHTGKTNHTKDELMIKTDTSGGKGASVCGNQLMHPAGYSVFQGLQVIEQSERSYQHVHTQHFKTRAHQFRPVPTRSSCVHLLRSFQSFLSHTLKILTPSSTCSSLSFFPQKWLSISPLSSSPLLCYCEGQLAGLPACLTRVPLLFSPPYTATKLSS